MMTSRESVMDSPIFVDLQD